MPAARLPYRSPHVLLALTTLLWAGHWVVARGVREGFTPAALAFWRWSLAVLVLGVIAGPGLYRKRRLLRGHWLRIAFFGLTGTGIYNVLTYRGVQLTTATNGLLLQSLTPALIPLLAWLLFRERIGLRPALGVALSFAGMLAIVSRLEMSVLTELRFNGGDLWILASVLFWALYTVCLRWKPPQLRQMEFLFASALIGLVPLAPLYLLEASSGGIGLEPSWEMALVVLYLGVFLSVFSYVLWSLGVHALGASAAGVYLNLIPVFGIAMAIVLLSERPQLYHAAGFLLIVAGVWLAARRGPA